VKVSIPGFCWSGIAGQTNSPICINTGIVVTFNQKAIDTISDAAKGGDVSILINKVDPAGLSESVSAKVGNRPVYELTVDAGGTKVTQFGGGKARVSVPYSLRPGENENAIIAYCIDNDGKLKVMIGRYHQETRTVEFETTHFSSFAIGYNPVVFADVQSLAWYKDAVDFISAREVTQGTGKGMFDPDLNLTRGQFIVMLMKAYGMEPDANPAENFTDAGDTWYTGYLAAAKRMNISAGTGNNLFKPDKEISRQEMFKLVYNTLKLLGKLPAASSTADITAYADADLIAPWAREAMTVLLKAGVIKGDSSSLYPEDTATRAEMAQLIFTLVK
jgi:hypothetical protein